MFTAPEHDAPAPCRPGLPTLTDKGTGRAWPHLHPAALASGQHASLADVQGGHRRSCPEAVHGPEGAHIPDLQPGTRWPARSSAQLMGPMLADAGAVPGSGGLAGRHKHSSAAQNLTDRHAQGCTARLDLLLSKWLGVDAMVLSCQGTTSCTRAIHHNVPHAHGPVSA